MNNEVDKVTPDDDEAPETDDGQEIEDGDNFTDTVVLTETSTDDGVDAGSTAEIKVERLIKELDKTDEEDAAHKKEVRRRLEELAEEQSLDDTYAVDFDKD